MSDVTKRTTPAWFTETRPVKPGRNLAFMFAALACLVSGFFAAQAVADERAMSVQSFDLQSRHGVQATYQRLIHIAYQHCDLPIEKSPNAQGRECVNEVMDTLLNKVADPFLSYVHEYPEEVAVAQR